MARTYEKEQPQPPAVCDHEIKKSVVFGFASRPEVGWLFDWAFERIEKYLLGSQSLSPINKWVHKVSFSQASSLE